MIQVLIFVFCLPLLCYGFQANCNLPGRFDLIPSYSDCKTVLGTMHQRSREANWRSKVQWGHDRGDPGWGCGHTWSSGDCHIQLSCDEDNLISFEQIWSLAGYAVEECVEKKHPLSHTALAYLSKESPWWITINKKPVGMMGPHIHNNILLPNSGLPSPAKQGSQLSSTLNEFYRGTVKPTRPIRSSLLR